MEGKNMKAMNVKLERNAYGMITAVGLTNDDLDKAFDNVNESHVSFDEEIGYDLAEAYPEMDV